MRKLRLRGFMWSAPNCVTVTRQTSTQLYLPLMRELRWRCGSNSCHTAFSCGVWNFWGMPGQQQWFVPGCRGHWPPPGSLGLRLRKTHLCPGSAIYICVPSTDTRPPYALFSPTWNTCLSNLIGKLWYETIPKDWQVLQIGWTHRPLISQNKSSRIP